MSERGFVLRAKGHRILRCRGGANRAKSRAHRGVFLVWTEPVVPCATQDSTALADDGSATR